MKNNINAVLFDLDGTLLDTAPDLGYALNLVLKQNDLPNIPLKKIRTVASDGIKGLFKLGLGITETHPDFHNLRNQFLEYYAENISRKTRFFPGMSDVLDLLAKKNIPWGIVTNKIARLTEKLLVNLNLQEQASCVVSGDTLNTVKPHPAPLLHAAQLMGCTPEHCIYVGDAERDIEAGRRAGMFTVAALYGYINENEHPKNWHADYYIKQPTDLMMFFKDIQ